MIKSYGRIFTMIQGYSELGMYDDALAEFDNLPIEPRGSLEALEMRVMILMQAKRWETALQFSQEISCAFPKMPVGFIHAAFCLHELQRTEEARDTLIHGPESLHTESSFHYNLACYECVLGHTEVARLHLERGISIDKKLRGLALHDPDLATLRL